MPTVKEITDYYKENSIDLTYVDSGIQKLRMSICRSCKEYNKTLAKCKVCGCFMRFKTKLMYDPIESHKAAEKKKTECPKGLW